MASTIDQIKSRITKNQIALSSEIDLVIKDLEIFLSRNIPKILSEALKGNKNPATALDQLIRAFKEKGLAEQMGNIAEIYGNQLRRIESDFVSEGIINIDEFQTVINLDTVEALIRFRVENIKDKSNQALTSIRPVIMENIILGVPSDLPLLANSAVNSLLTFTKTELNTSLLAFDRTISLVQSEELGIEKFIYVGPYDKATRPFCSKVLTKKSPPIYSLLEIKSMNNGQDLLVEIYAGGYNCRHKWFPVSNKKANQIKREWDSNNYVEGGEGQ